MIVQTPIVFLKDEKKWKERRGGEKKIKKNNGGLSPAQIGSTSFALF